MKKLLKHISPLAPDDSGACSVLYELGGITVICDAGGCAGNVCGFDEPRWFEKKSALFSAGLRDMDAILGRDDRLVEKLAKVCEQVSAQFTAIVGTPVPAVIATDYKALKRMSEKKTGLPCITVEADGTKLYDKGEEEAYLRLFEEFAVGKLEAVKGKVGVIGATPLNTGLTRADDIIDELKKQGCAEVVCFGMDSGLDEIRKAASCEELMVIAPSGIKAAKYLQEKFGVKISYGFPCLPDDVKEKCEKLGGKRALIIHQQIAANALRELMTDCDVDCASWFEMNDELKMQSDLHISSEEQLSQTVGERGYDVIIADEFFKRAVSGFKGEWIDLPHFAVSGRLQNSGMKK